MTVSTVLSGLQVRLDTIDGLRATNYVPDAPNLPAAFVVPPDIDYHRTMQNGLTQLNIEIVVFVTAASGDRMRGASLMDYAEVTGTYSVKAAIEADKTLGGAADDTIVDRFRPLGIEEVAAYQMYGGAFDVRVLLS